MPELAASFKKGEEGGRKVAAFRVAWKEKTEAESTQEGQGSTLSQSSAPGHPTFDTGS